MDLLRRARALLLLTALPAGLVALAVPAPAQAAAPGNDNRSDATTMQYGHSYGVTTTEATTEAGEAQPCGVPSGHSVWYRFSPSVSGFYVLDTVGSPLDTVVSVENSTGTTLGCNDDVERGVSGSRLEIAMTSGATYYVRVAGYGNASGNFLMYLLAKAPANDDRAAAANLTFNGSREVGLLQASTEPDEPSAECEAGLHSTVWYRYVPTQAGRLTIGNGNTWAARMRLFDATTSTPQALVCDSYHDGDTGQFGTINQYVRPGRTYLLQVGAPPGVTAERTTIAAGFTPGTQPANDSFATPVRLGGTRGSVAVPAGQLTTEAFEWPLYGGSRTGLHSAWYRWTAPSSGTLRLTVPDGLQTVLVWKDVAYPWLLDGTGLGTRTAAPGGGVVRSVPVTRGTTYRILADWRSPAAFTVSYALDTTATAPAAPARPTVKVRHRTAVVTWRVPADRGATITGYTLTVRGTVAGRKRTIVRQVGPAARRTVLRGLKPGRYRVVVTATNAIGTSPASPSVRFRIR
ncbi:fibronectin type III domain-containing protein [Pimelobacter simplex]|uniref:fibronectin type III domain-containing protein n=1 Tax=Nocardioides simplex TaxID=2045 RepID=UPI002150680A|nr:fibronectin type III domain-containing protein [Pimelobacter simplex]UUW89418.1 fibronectin type III domain-containing protein [Pimelobacter simplex]UUW93246.1 fibronectin type III domain-containing protein [Pimelobacter simplex]